MDTTTVNIVPEHCNSKPSKYGCTLIKVKNKIAEIDFIGNESYQINTTQ
jgi:hypothetical protein